METGSSTRGIKISSRAATLRPRRRVRSRRLVGVYVRSQRGLFAFGLCSRVASRAWARTHEGAAVSPCAQNRGTNARVRRERKKTTKHRFHPATWLMLMMKKAASRIKIFQPCIVTCAPSHGMAKPVFVSPRRSSPGVTNDYQITIDTFVRACVHCRQTKY
jgi:hypothetical protein